MIVAERALAARPPTESRPWLVRLYVIVERLRRRFARGVAALAERVGNLVMGLYRGVWLGLLDRNELSAITSIAYDEGRGSDRWDEPRYVESGLYTWEKDFIARLLPGARVLIGCAGAGREAFALERGGFAVTAFDCSDVLLTAARTRAAADGAAIRFVNAMPDETPDLGTFDAAIVGWGGYIHIVGSGRRIGFLRGIRRQLVGGAPLLVSFSTRPEKSRRFGLSTAIAGSVRRLRSKEPIELGDDLTHVGTFAHCFTRDEIAAELEAAGFALDWFGAKDLYAVKDGYAVGIARP